MNAATAATVGTAAARKADRQGATAKVAPFPQAPTPAPGGLKPGLAANASPRAAFVEGLQAERRPGGPILPAGAFRYGRSGAAR